MEKITRTIKTQVVTITERATPTIVDGKIEMVEGKEISKYTVKRKTDTLKETKRAIKELKRSDFELVITELEVKMEMSLEDFMEHATEVVEEVEVKADGK